MPEMRKRFHAKEEKSHCESFHVLRRIKYGQKSVLTSLFLGPIFLPGH